jgi:hypothetical protein
MPPAAVAIGSAAIGAAGSIGGSLLGKKSSQPQLIKIPPPAPFFPEANKALGAALPGVLSSGVGALESAASGSVTDVSKLFEAIRAESQRSTSEGMASISEQFGASGLRYGSDLMRSLTDYRLQAGKQLTTTLEDLLYKSTESAKTRQLQAGSVLSELGFQASQSYYPTAVVAAGGQSQNPVQAGISGALGMLQLVDLFKQGTSTSGGSVSGGGGGDSGGGWSGWDG